MQNPSESLNHSDRTERLRCAMDPGTPIAALLGLAMEFPDQVAVNPALPIAVAAEPSSLLSGDAVALACLLSSPAIPEAFRAALHSIVRSAAATDATALGVMQYLEAWSEAGEQRVMVDVSRPGRASPGLESWFERSVRGRALLAARLGLDRLSTNAFEKEGCDACGTMTRGARQHKIGARHRLLLDPLMDGGTISRSCEWRRDRGSTRVWLADYVGDASIVLSVFPGRAPTALLEFEHPKVTDSYLVDIPQDSAARLAEFAQPIAALAKRLPQEKLLVVVSPASNEDSLLHAGALGVAEFLEYLAEDPEQAQNLEEYDAPSANLPEWVHCLQGINFYKLGHTLDGGSDGGDINALVERLDTSAVGVLSGSRWSCASVHQLFEAVVPKGSLRWVDNRHEGRPGRTDELPSHFIALADSSGAAVFVFMHFRWADGWGEWEVMLDPFIEVG